MNNNRREQQHRINEQIRSQEVRVVGEGESEVYPIKVALKMAQEEGYELEEELGYQEESTPTRDDILGMSIEDLLGD